MASAEGGSVPSGVRYGEGCPLSSRLRGLGERRELLQRGPGRAPAKNGFWRILKATERSFLYLYDKIWAGGTIRISIPRSKFWGDLSPPLSSPWSTPMGLGLELGLGLGWLRCENGLHPVIAYEILRNCFIRGRRSHGAALLVSRSQVVQWWGCRACS